jgi:hypothetical protein
MWAGVARAANRMVRPCSRPASKECWQGGTEDKEHAMSQKLETSPAPAVIGIDIRSKSPLAPRNRGEAVRHHRPSPGTRLEPVV